MTVFKKCLPCDKKWFARDDFLWDPDIKIIGYQVNFDDLVAGAFLFNHSCGATLALSVRYFNGLYEGPIFKDRITGSDDCPGYCLYLNLARKMRNKEEPIWESCYSGS